MKLNLKGIELEIPDNAKVHVSEDGKQVRVETPEPEVIEKIRVIEGSDRVVERIVTVDVPCMLPHYPCNLQHYPHPNQWITWTTTGTTPSNLPYSISTCGAGEAIGGLYGSGSINGGWEVGQQMPTSNNNSIMYSQ